MEVGEEVRRYVPFVECRSVKIGGVVEVVIAKWKRDNCVASERGQRSEA